MFKKYWFFEDKETLFKEVRRRMADPWSVENFDRRKVAAKDHDFRVLIRVRDDYTCHDCGDKSSLNQVAHYLPVQLFPELVFEPENARVLCKDCHKKEPRPSWRALAKQTKDMKEGLARLEQDIASGRFN